MPQAFNTIRPKPLPPAAGKFGEHSTDAIRFSFSCGTAMVREGCDALRRALA